MQDRTEDGRRFRMLTVIDEYTRRCLAIVVARRLRSDDVLHCLTELIVTQGTPEHIRSDNGPEFVARNVGQANKFAKTEGEKKRVYLREQ
jgi:transposase InsO family protein